MSEGVREVRIGWEEVLGGVLGLAFEELSKVVVDDDDEGTSGGGEDKSTTTGVTNNCDAERKGGSVVMKCIFDDVGGRGRPTSSFASRRAVQTKLSSPSSAFPPGNAVCPGCARSDLERVVNNTLSSPACSYSRTSTAASLEVGCRELHAHSF